MLEHPEPLAGYATEYQGRSQDFEEGGAIIKEGAKHLIFSRAAPKFGWPEATPLISDVIINLSAKLGMAQSSICIEKPTQLI